MRELSYRFETISDTDMFIKVYNASKADKVFAGHIHLLWHTEKRCYCIAFDAPLDEERFAFILHECYMHGLFDENFTSKTEVIK